jgi:hypothetical protein
VSTTGSELAEDIRVLKESGFISQKNHVRS